MNEKKTRILIDLDTFELTKVDEMALTQNRNRKNMVEVIIKDALK